MIITRNLTVKHDVDVFVAGGGPAGVAAAYTAAKQGKRVFIAEELGAFGGSGTCGLVPELMNFDDGKNFLAGGFGAEVFRRAIGERTDYSRRVYNIKVEEMKRLYDDLIKESGAEFSFFTKLVDVETVNGHIEGVVLAAKQGLFAVKAKIYIDCTGDGTLSALAGARFELGEPTANGRTMPTTLCSLWANVDFEAKGNLHDGTYMGRAISDGVIPQYDPVLPGLKAVDYEHGIAGGNVGHVFFVNPTDEKSLTDAMVFGRHLVTCYQKYYRDYYKHGCEDVVLLETANILGVRESRRIMGDKKLTVDYYRSTSAFEDEIGRYSYPIDIHNETPDEEGVKQFCACVETKHGDGESYGIPYGALTPVGLDNLLVAGKCISADRPMQASVRVIPGCYITGQAAGAAAALASAVGDVRAIDIRELQSTLSEIGAYLPNFNK
jgi:hypothetical protein